MNATTQTNPAQTATTQTNPAPAIGPRAAAAREAAKTSWSVTRIDRLAGGRSCLIRPNVACPKKPGSIAHANWSLYGDGEVSVAAFLSSYPADQGGLGRARTSLAWDLNYGYVSIVSAAGEVLDA